MKKIILFLLVLSVMSFNAFAQLSIEVKKTKPGTTLDIIGDTTISESPTTSELFFEIKNIATSDSISIRVTKLIFADVSKTNIGVCPPKSNCVELSPTNANIKLGSFFLKQGESGEGHIVYNHGTNVVGTSIVELTIYTGNWATAPESDKFTFTVSFSNETQTVAISKTSNFSIYPNPANGSFIVTADFTPKTRLEVYSVTGNKVFEVSPKGGKSYTIDCSRWDKGYYFCRLVTDDKVIKTLKLVITR